MALSNSASRRSTAKESKRFSKASALQVLDARAAQIAKLEKFDRSNGTSQLLQKQTPISGSAHLQELVRRAVQYGRMTAFEQFACAIEEGFRFEDGSDA